MNINIQGPMKIILVAFTIAMTVTFTAHASLAAKWWVASDEAKH